jgi:ectoine hydroxylase-related dioxygenase (phytanoyl-CoA dioxygenase family)
MGHRLSAEELVLDLVEQVLGPDIILWGSSIFAKPPGVGKKVPWHQDSRWWPMRPIVNCTMWIAVDDSTPENGCLRYIPRSHKWDIMPHLDEIEQGLLGSSIDENLFRQEDTRDIVLTAGRFSLHQANLVHGSEVNVSSKRRAGLVLRYMPASSYFDRSDAKQIGNVGLMKTGGVPRYGHRPIWLERGENRRPGNDFRIGHERLEDLDLAARSAVERRCA